MAIYSRPVRELMRDMAEALGSPPGTIFSKRQAVSWFSEHYPKVKAATVSAHLIRLSTNAPSRVHYNARPGDDDVFFQIDGGHFRKYDSANDPAPIRADDEPPEPPVTGGKDVASAAASEFAYEADLRNYLAKNLSVIEPGMQLYEEEGITGIEFPVGGRFIDILAVDSSGALVVIELKVSRGYDRVVGQLMRYIAWIKQNLAEADQNVHGVIVARGISDDLSLACSLLPSVRLYEYEMSLSLKLINVP